MKELKFNIERIINEVEWKMNEFIKLEIRKKDASFRYSNNSVIQNEETEICAPPFIT